MENVLHAELSEKIIGAAMKVLKGLRPGLSERAYENALIIELRKSGCVVSNSGGLKCDTTVNSSTSSSPT